MRRVDSVVGFCAPSQLPATSDWGVHAPASWPPPAKLILRTPLLGLGAPGAHVSCILDPDACCHEVLLSLAS